MEALARHRDSVSTREWDWIFSSLWTACGRENQGCRLNVPQTILFKHGEPRKWISTSASGHVTRISFGRPPPGARKRSRPASHARRTRGVVGGSGARWTTRRRTREWRGAPTRGRRKSTKDLVRAHEARGLADAARRASAYVRAEISDKASTIPAKWRSHSPKTQRPGAGRRQSARCLDQNAGALRRVGL